MVLTDTNAKGVGLMSVVVFSASLIEKERQPCIDAGFSLWILKSSRLLRKKKNSALMWLVSWRRLKIATGSCCHNEKPLSGPGTIDRYPIGMVCLPLSGVKLEGVP